MNGAVGVGVVSAVVEFCGRAIAVIGFRAVNVIAVLGAGISDPTNGLVDTLSTWKSAEGKIPSGNMFVASVLHDAPPSFSPSCDAT